MRDIGCNRRPAAGKVPLTKMALMFGFSRVTHHQPLALRGTPPWFMQDLVTFLLVRGAYAWLGYGWQGCTNGDTFSAAGSGYGFWRPEMDEDYGVPTDETCSETAHGSGVFTRSWSKAKMELDCGAWTARIIMNDGRVLQ